MAEGMTTDRVRSYSSGILGRCLNTARTQHYVIDSSGGPLIDGKSQPPEALTTVEAFLSGISACAVTLVEKHAAEIGVPLRRMDVTLAAHRTKENPANFHSMDLHFTIEGVSQEQAEDLVQTYRNR